MWLRRALPACAFVLIGAGLCLYPQLLPAAGAPEPAIDPAFARNIEIWLSPRPPSSLDNGTLSSPYGVGSPGGFDRLMFEFRQVGSVTFRLDPGVYLTSGNFEASSRLVAAPDAWEPESGWRMIGAGIGQTILKLDSPLEDLPTKYTVVGNSRSGRILEHFELAHMTIDASGEQLSRTLDSNFGCVFLTGSYLYLHDLLCVGGFNALSPRASNAATHRELFIVGVAGRDGFNATNNVVERCEVRLDPSSPKSFPGAIEGLTTAIINGANTFARNGTNYFSYAAAIRGCVVKGVDAKKRVNGISMFGVVDGMTVSNLVTDVQFAFYTDDGLFSPRAFIVGNNFSNVIAGIYFNYNGSTHRWGQLALLNNDIVLWADPLNIAIDSQDYGINLVGAPDPQPVSFKRTVVAGNRIRSGRGSAPKGRDMDYGIQLVRHEQACVASNVVDLLRNRNALKVLREPIRGDEYLFTNNVSGKGQTLLVHDRSLPGCRPDDPPALEPCRYVSDYFWPPVIGKEFGFANRSPRQWEYVQRSNSIVRPMLLWKPDTAALSGWVHGLGPGSDASVYSPERGGGYMKVSVYVPASADYWLWLRIAVPDLESTGFFDVEVDGDRRFFGLNSLNTTTNWAWHPVTERMPISNENQLRVLALGAGWHEIILWARNPWVKVSQLCLTTRAPGDLALNDRIVRRVESDGRSKAETASESYWAATVFAPDGSASSPMEWVRSESIPSEAHVFSRVDQRGEIVFDVPIPRAGLYEASVLMMPWTDDLSHASGYLLIDGVEWIVACNQTPDWQWSTRVGKTEASARSMASNRFHLTPGWHRIAYRTRQRGVGLGGVRMTAVH